MILTAINFVNFLEFGGNKKKMIKPQGNHT